MQSGPEEDTNHNKEERRPTIGENGNEEMDYNVEVALKIIFKNREFNCLLRPEEAERFARYKIHQEEDKFEERGFTLQS